MAKAIRPVFIPSDDLDKLVEIRDIEFEWHMGMSMAQKKRSVHSFHERAKDLNIFPILEISSRSDSEIGKSLSAFNLFLNIGDGGFSVESIFQGSKVFEKGGPFIDLYNRSGWEIKMDNRLKDSGMFIGFSFNNKVYPIEPKTIFYDWLYVTALIQNIDTSKELLNYNAFSDIAFNPKKSYNCQAYSAALFVSLYKKGQIEIIKNDKDIFFSIISSYKINKTINNQGQLF